MSLHEAWFIAIGIWFVHAEILLRRALWMADAVDNLRGYALTRDLRALERLVSRGGLVVNFILVREPCRA